MKVGDRVTLNDVKWDYGNKMYKDEFKGTIVKILHPSLFYTISVKWDYGRIYSYNEGLLMLLDKPIMDVEDLFKDIEL